MVQYSVTTRPATAAVAGAQWNRNATRGHRRIPGAGGGLTAAALPPAAMRHKPASPTPAIRACART